VADAVPIDHIISRVLATVPLPQVSARPQGGAAQYPAGSPA
jgi:MoxR-like ATPase